MREFIKTYEIWIFLILAPIINTIFVYFAKIGYIYGGAYTHGRFFILMLLLVIIVKFTRGNEGIKEIFKPMVHWRVHPKWYLFSLIFAVTIATITLLLKMLYTGDDFSSVFIFRRETLRFTINVFIWAFVGEVVWVSYSVRQLSKTINLFYASQIIGVFWTIWWIPIVYLNVSVVADLPILPLLFSMMAVAGMCAYVYAKTKSGICVLILQFMLNMTLLVMPVSPSLGGVPTYIAFSAIYFIVMLGFMYSLNKNKKLTQVEKL